MSISVACPSCAAKLNAPDGAAGKKVKCPKCQTPMLVPEPPVATEFEVVEEPQPQKRPAARPKVKAVVDLDDEDEKPRKKRAKDEDDEEEEVDRPKKKKKKKRSDDEEGGVSMARNIVMGIVLIILLCVAAYVFYDRSKKKDDTSSNTSGDVAAAAPGGPNGPDQEPLKPGLGGTQTGQQPKPSVYAGPQTLIAPGGFRITFPGPYRSNERASGEIQKRIGLRGSVHEWESDSVQVLCIYMEIPPNFSAEDKKKLSDVLFQAFVVEGTQAVVVESRTVQQGGFDWDEYHTKQADSSTMAIKRLQITSSHAFLLGVRKESGSPPSELVKRFFDSFSYN